MVVSSWLSLWDPLEVLALTCFCRAVSGRKLVVIARLPFLSQYP